MIVIFTRIFRGLKTCEIWYSGQATLFSYSPTFFCIPTSSLGFLLWFDLQDNCCTPSSCSPLSPQIPSLVLFHIQYLHYLPVSLQLVISLFLVLVPLLFSLIVMHGLRMAMAAVSQDGGQNVPYSRTQLCQVSRINDDICYAEECIVFHTVSIMGLHCWHNSNCLRRQFR